MSKHEGMYVVKHHPSPGVTLTIRQVATALGTAVVSMSIVGIVGTLDVPVPGLLKLPRRNCRWHLWLSAGEISGNSVSWRHTVIKFISQLSPAKFIEWTSIGLVIVTFLYSWIQESRKGGEANLRVLIAKSLKAGTFTYISGSRPVRFRYTGPSVSRRRRNVSRHSWSR